MKLSHSQLCIFSIVLGSLLLCYSSELWSQIRLKPASLGSAAQDDMFDEFDEFEEDSGSELESEAGIELENFRGFLSSKLRTYLNGAKANKNSVAWLNEFEFEFDIHLNPELLFYLRPRIQLDPIDDDHNRFMPYELYLEYRQDRYDVRVGQSVESWGIVDTFNPIDILNRPDNSFEFLESKRLGEIMLRARYFAQGNDTFGEPTLSAYILPVWQPTLFPGDHSRFSLTSRTNDFDADRDVQPQGEERLFYALRAQSTLSTELFSADLQLLTARGPDRAPQFASRVIAGRLTTLPVYHGVWIVGGGIRAVANAESIAEITWKAEFAYKRHYEFDRSNIDAPEDHSLFVVGFDYPQNDVFVEKDQLTWTLEYAADFGADDFAAKIRLLNNDFIGRLFWEANDFARSSIESRLFFDLDTQESIAQLIFERQLRSIHKDLKFTCDFQAFIRNKNRPSLFNSFPNNTNLTLGLKWEF